jgi:cell division protein FtsB
MLTTLRSLRFLFNKYTLAVIIALVWLLFFDSYSVLSQMRMYKRVQKLRHDIAELQADIEQLEAACNHLTLNPEAMEHLARERYLMKRPNEDLFLLKTLER